MIINQMKKPKISIILPTRKRTELLVKSISSLLANAADTSNIEILIAYDSDDDESKTFFQQVWADFIAQSSATTRIFEVERFGYLNLNKYVNLLGENASGDWIMFWNDDAYMLTENWDELVIKETGWFGLVRIPCSNMNHPFALFPIIPRSWIDVFGTISPVAHSDWWIYHVAKNAERIKDINALVYHDRADVTGNNNDITFQERSYDADGKNPNNPNDYTHPDRLEDLRTWIENLNNYLTVSK